MKRLLVIGGGFAGVRAAQSAACTARRTGHELEVTLLAESEWLTVRPRLYLPSPSAWQVPLRDSLASLEINLVRGKATRVDLENCTVALNSGSARSAVSFDGLVIATGSRLRWPDVPGLAEHAFHLDTAQGAADLLKAIGRLREDELSRPVVVIGGGFTGLEVATELRSTIAMKHGPERAACARVMLIERQASGPDLGKRLAPVLRRALEVARVETRFGQSVAGVSEGSLSLDGGERVEFALLIYAGGLEASPLEYSHHVLRDDLGRLKTDRYLRIQGSKHVFAAGDAASAVVDDNGRLAPMSCQHAIPMGEQAGRNAASALLGLPLETYAQPDYVTCLDLGIAGAVFAQGWERTPQLEGAPAKRVKQAINAMIAPLSGDAETIACALAAVPAPGESLSHRLGRFAAGPAQFAA